MMTKEDKKEITDFEIMTGQEVGKHTIEEKIALEIPLSEVEKRIANGMVKKAIK